MKSLYLFFWGYIVVIFLLLFYSYTQVDLSLTLSRLSIYQTVEKMFQYIGYFQRPLSAELFIGVLLLLFGFYISFIRLSFNNKLSTTFIWRIVICMSVLLFFSYNAFSYDLFNYIFDAKIITHYHLNPYLYKALDFPGDPMLSFMRWTHRYYPYGPVWLVATVPLSFVGMQFFLPTFFLFKLLMVGSFIVSIFFIQKILEKTSPKDVAVGMVLFAFNPLVLIESLVNAHMDIFMLALTYIAIFLLIQRKYVWSFIFLILSIGVKYGTAALLPVFVYVYMLNRQKKTINWQRIFLIFTIFMIPPFIAVIFRTNFQPWYILFVLPFAMLLGKKLYVAVAAVILSFFFLLEYLPYIYLGNYNPPVPFVLNTLTISGIFLAIVSIIVLQAKDLLFGRKRG